LLADSSVIDQQFTVGKPHLWSVEDPYLYKAVTTILVDGKQTDSYSTSFGVRTFLFDVNAGFSLNGKPMKINGVCNHHDLGALGAAVNTTALRRQLQLLKNMGCNAIRTSHNPPAPELLELTDQMGFVVMDEAFDMWKQQKTSFDYHLYWDEWHRRDLGDQVRRDRNHPSVFIWSIGNEVPEQWNAKDSAGAVIARELREIVRSLDTTRPIVDANNNPVPQNPILRSGAVDLIGYNYRHNDFFRFPEQFPGQRFIATETVSALESRGHYDMPADSIRRWPKRWDKALTNGNPDYTVSAYDNVSAPWGSTHEETWKEIKKYPFLSGQFIWTGFDYLGEPTPYPWPARSSYFGIIDLAGFPKDVYYMYQSEWTSTPVLHLLPHWNWKAGDSVDVWAYYSQADEAELFLNGRSLGVRRKSGDDLHVKWKVRYEPGNLKVVSRRNGRVVLTDEVKTAGAPVAIRLRPEESSVSADGRSLLYVDVTVVDRNGVAVPTADNEISFSVDGVGDIVGTDNGCETDHRSLKSPTRNAFNGKALAIIQSSGKKGNIILRANSKGLEAVTLSITAK
jgi:beta-galactosidase